MTISDIVSTTVGSFIDYALIIVLIMIIWYIFKFFFIAPPPTKEERERELTEQRKGIGDWWKGREEKSKAAATAEARKKEEEKAKYEEKGKKEKETKEKERAVSKRRETVEGVKGFVLEAERSADKAIEALHDDNVKDLKRDIESITRRLQSARRGVTALIHNVGPEHKDFFRKLSAYITNMRDLSEQIRKNLSYREVIEMKINKIIAGCGYLHKKIDDFVNEEKIILEEFAAK